MKHRFLLFILLAFAVSSLQAQKSASDINRVKRDKSYLYGEATLNSKEAALKLAYELLVMEIKNWATQKDTNISSVIASKVYDYADTIILPRGNMVRAFAYVKISNLKSVKGKQMRIDIDDEKDQVVNTTPVENRTEISKEKTPVLSADTMAVVAQTPPKQQIIEDTVKTKAIEVNEIVANENKVEEKDPALPIVSTAEEEVITSLKNVSSFYDLEKTMKPLKESGKILDYGKYADMKDPSNTFLIIYDRQANIKALLGKGVTERKNLKTGLVDSEKNYHGCGAIWFKIKQ